MIRYRRLLALALTGAALTTTVGARAGVVSVPPLTHPETLYLHSLAPVSTVEASGPTTGLTAGPTMDASAPTSPVPKVGVIGPGNSNFNKNPLLPWWAGQVHGVVSEPTVDLYVPTTVSKVTATLFADGPVNVASPIGRASATVPVGATHVTITFAGVSAQVDNELVLSIDAGNAGSVLYDSTGTPSSLTFQLGPYVAPPPGPGPTGSPGFNNAVAVSTEHAARETSLAIDPVDPATMLICDPSGVPATADGHSWFFRSTDTGASWREINNESPGDSRSAAFEGGDCDVAFDAAGTMYTADTWLGDLSVGSSRDGGATWSGTALAGTSPGVDRPWLVGGPAGTVHVTYQDLQSAMPSAIWYTRSTDYGQTFTPAVPVATANSRGGFTWQGNFVVSPDGNDLYSVYTRRQGPSAGLDDNGPEAVTVAASHDGGTTWTSHVVAAMPNPASYLYPSIAMDAGGLLHVVFVSKTSTDRPVWYSVSTDNAESWTPAIKVTSGASGFAPWVAAGARGQAYLEWYGSPNPQADLAATEDWYTYWAKISDGDTASPTITSGTTTTGPLFHGAQGEAPEFNQVRLDPNGKMRFGTSAGFGDPSSPTWALYYQAES